jgi:hypothetical protein
MDMLEKRKCWHLEQKGRPFFNIKNAPSAAAPGTLQPLRRVERSPIKSARETTAGRVWLKHSTFVKGFLGRRKQRLGLY